MKVSNQKCIRRLSFRFLRANRRRNRIAVFAIALTTLLFTSLFTIVLSLNSSYETYQFRQLGGYAHGTFKDVSPEQAERIAAHPNVKEVGARKVIGISTEGVFSKIPAEISYMDANCTKWSYATPTTGRMPTSGKEVAMDTAALQMLGITPELGAEVTVSYSVTDKDQTAFPVTDTFTLVGFWDYDDLMPVHYINIPADYASSIEAQAAEQGLEPFRVDLNVMMASAANIRGQMEQVDTDLGYTWDSYGDPNSVRIGVNWGYTTSQMASQLDPQTVIAIAAFLLLVIFTGYLIIYNIFQISVTGDIRFYGLLKTIGTTPRQLKRIIRQQALLLCVIGIPAGMLLGYGVGAVLTPVVMARTTFGAGITTISASPLIFLASALFALVTVLLSCSRPGRIASKVSPVEATKYTEIVRSKKKRRTTRGAKVYQMAFANLGRNKRKTVLVVISLSLSVVLLNILVTFTGGFDMEKYLAKRACADFIVSSTDYFRYNGSSSYISQEQIEQIKANTSLSLSGCGYTLTGYTPYAWMSEEHWLQDMMHYRSEENAKALLEQQNRRDDLVSQSALIEGLDEDLFEKLTVIAGDISPMFQEDSKAIAVVVRTDDYGNVSNPDFYPPVGSVQTITYIDEGHYTEIRTGNLCDENTSPEYIFQPSVSHDVDYTVCAYVTVPHSMSFRYYTTGYSFVLPIEKLNNDSQHESIPMFYLFDTPDNTSEASAENYLADLTADNLSGLIYESKAKIRAEFESFQTMFLLLGGLLCAIVGLVGVLNFFNAIMTGILSRRREFAVLQAVGMTGRQLNTMLVYEGLFYAMGSAGAALVLSVVMSPLLGKLMEKMFWFFSARFNVIPALTAIPLFALLGWLIPTAMHKQAMKYSVVERLRDAE